MGRTRSRCRIVPGVGEYDPRDGEMPACRRFLSRVVRREVARAEERGETILVATVADALVTPDEPTHLPLPMPAHGSQAWSDLSLRLAGPIGAHDEAVFVRPNPVEADPAVVAAWEEILAIASDRVAVPMAPEAVGPLTLAVTYCSRRKSEAPGDLAAIERYASPRVRTAYELAVARSHPFRILSGRYGLLRPSSPIPYYDHLLAPEEVEAMVDRVAPGIEGYDEVVLLAADGDYVAPYRDVLSAAAARARASFRLEVIPIPVAG